MTAHFALAVTAFGDTKPLSHWAIDPGRPVRTPRSTGTCPRDGTHRGDRRTTGPRSTLGTGVPHHAFGSSMGLEDWARLTQIPAGYLRHRIEQYGRPSKHPLLSASTSTRNPRTSPTTIAAANSFRPTDTPVPA